MEGLACHMERLWKGYPPSQWPLEVCKSTSIISVDDDSPKPPNTASGLAGLQMLHPIPDAGHELGGVGLGLAPCIAYSL